MAEGNMNHAEGMKANSPHFSRSLAAAHAALFVHWHRLEARSHNVTQPLQAVPLPWSLNGLVASCDGLA